MATLNIIGEFLHNWESEINFAAARDLTLALAETAPRGHASALLIASDTIPPQTDNVKASVAKIPLRSTMLPLMWHSSQAARPLDGEYVHALTPLAPLRTRDEYDGSQTSIMIPHTLAWDCPELLPKGQARQLRAFTRRAIKHADVIVAPTHTVADRLEEIYGSAIEPHVLPLAAPAEFLTDAHSGQRRQELQLPEKYVLTVSSVATSDRLNWVLNAVKNNASIPELLIISHDNDFELSAWPELADRVTIFKPEKLADIGIVLGGAEALLLPEEHADTLFCAYGALAQGIPVVHGGNKSVVEISLDSAVGGASEEAFTDALLEVVEDSEERERLSILGVDRSKSFSWQQTAWQLWEIHANI